MSENIQDAEVAWRETKRFRSGDWATTERSAFYEGRTSRDAEVAELREQLTEAQSGDETKRTLESQFVEQVGVADRAVKLQEITAVALVEAQVAIEKVRAYVTELSDAPEYPLEAHHRGMILAILSAPSSTGGN